MSEITDKIVNDSDNRAFKESAGSEQTIHHISTRDPRKENRLRRDYDDVLNQLREDIEKYIETQIANLKDSMLTEFANTSKEDDSTKGAKGDKGDRGPMGLKGDQGDAAAGALTAGDFLAINDSVITTTYYAGLGVYINPSTGEISGDYTAGTGIDITDGVISNTGGAYTAGNGIAISEAGVISVVAKTSGGILVDSEGVSVVPTDFLDACA